MKLSLLVFLVLFRICESMKSAIVVGAGPAGIATALVLARRHGYQVTILESAERTDVYDPTKAYPFLIRARGQKLTKLFPNVQQALEEQGIATEGATELVSIPADPKEEPKTNTIPVFQKNTGRNFWLRRHEFIRLLLEAAREEENITVINGASCRSVTAINDSVIEVCADQGGTSATPHTKTYTTSLVIAADGMKSKVRESLAQSPSPFPKWENNRPKGFKIKRWFSPASGLKFKVCVPRNKS
jgi:kynurenine 3-monooxygenase